MTTFEWAMVSISAGGFLLSAGGILAGCIWGVAKIKQHTVEQISAEREIRSEAIAKVAASFAADQKTQDHNFGEMGAALRRFIEEVEKEMHRIEIWGRDNYAIKDDVKALRADIKDMRKEIKDDFSSLSAKIDAKH